MTTQMIFLLDADIRKNVVFGVPEEEIDDERREKFIEATFTVIHKAGIRKLSEMNQLNIQTLNTILRSFSSLDSESKNLIIKIIFDLTHAYGKSVKDIIKNN